jgi:predicted kinase
MPKLTILIGAPASGKSTFAEWTVRTEPKTIRISRDEIRFAQFQEVLEGNYENIISKLIHAQIKATLENGWNLVVDNCNCRKMYITEIVENFKHLADIHFKVFDLPLDELLSRNKNRTRRVPKSVIEKMYNDLQNLKPIFDFSPIESVKKNDLIPLEIDDSKPKCIIVDIDGTLSNSDQRDIFNFRSEEIYDDTVIEQVNFVVRQLSEKSDVKIILCSGREDTHYEITEKWIREKCGFEFEKLIMRKAGDFRNDAIVKKEILDTDILPFYSPLFAIDDRKRVKEMWVANNIFVFDVNQHDLVF